MLRVAAMFMLAMLASAPVLHAAEASPLDALPYRHSHFDFKYAWKTTQVERGLAVDGVMKNVRYPYLDDVTLTVSLLNREEKVLADAMTFPFPQQTRMDDTRPFGVVLKNVVLSPGDRLRFLVRYRVVDGEDDAYNWMSSFTVDAATGLERGESVKPVDDR